MKAMLEFTLPDEVEDFEAACEATDMLGVLIELDEYLRGQGKYVELGRRDDVFQIRAHLRTLLDEAGVRLP